MSKRKNSSVWNYYDIDDVNSSRAICLLCPDRTRISRGGSIPSYYSTTPLARHLKSKHPKESELLAKVEMRKKQQLLKKKSPPLVPPAALSAPWHCNPLSMLPLVPVHELATGAPDLCHLTVEEFLEESKCYLSTSRKEKIAASAAPSTRVPDLGERLGGAPPSNKFTRASTSYADLSPVLEAEETGDGLHDPLLSEHTEQDESEESKAIAFEETLDEEANNSNSGPSNAEQSATFPTMSGFYLLKKDTHCTSILDQLLQDETYADVTLTAQGGSLKAHRIVLSLASGYFREVLSKDSAVKNVIFFKDLKFTELKNILNFIYTGEATVDASELESFMSIAEMLEIASLCDGHKSLPKQFIRQRRDAPEEAAAAVAASPPTTFNSKGGKRSSSATTTSSSPPTKSRKVASSQDSGYTSKSTSLSNLPNSKGDNTTIIIKTEPEYDDDPLDIEYEDPLSSSPNTSKNNKTSSDEYSLEKHKPGKCPYCPSSEPFHMGEQMTVHLQTLHSSKPFINCPLCSRVFTLKSLYKKHQELCNGS